MSSPTALDTTRACPACGTTGAPPDARYCEACGQALAVCGECGGTYDTDGYCTTCGAKAPVPRDHLVERPQPWLAAVSDRGLRHHRNEDAVATSADDAPGSRATLVVCDGVSTSEDSDVASLAAARAARGVLDGWADSVEARLTAAADAASRAVREATRPDHGDSPPSCTFVAAVVVDGTVVAGVVGDSRAYWLPDDGAYVQLTVDDSWAADQIAQGRSRLEAESAPEAHAITRWLGVDAPDHTPRITSADVEGPGWLLVCSDGLWNYCSPPQALGELVHQTASACDGDPLETAEALVTWANAQGGHDNITVALARLGTP